ncbi:MAG: 1-acyl-sn-glycerol-3-phosphate acyltransferase [Bacteroidota bacterium]
MAKKKPTKKTLPPHVMPEISDWPIYKLHQDRRNLIEEMDAFTIDRLQKKYGGELSSVIAKAIYMERIRIKEDPWKVDPPDERTFWKKVQSKLKEKSLDRSEEEAKAANLQILGKITNRYSEEVVGTFKIKTFLFARKFLTIFFSRLLNTSQGMLFRNRYQLYDRLRAVGELDTIRALMKKGTVVVLPTHSSNLDSILVGYVMDSVIGLPSFSYGAGLNLYNTGYTAYYMNRIGAYRVDRRKKNPIYLEVLKSFSNLAIQRGTNSLFFLGGTRSRSGAIENRLKKGLLGTVVEAQRAMYQKGEEKKVLASKTAW